jgi:hypothetical protein
MHFISYSITTAYPLHFSVLCVDYSRYIHRISVLCIPQNVQTEPLRTTPAQYSDTFPYAILAEAHFVRQWPLVPSLGLAAHIWMRNKDHSVLYGDQDTLTPLRATSCLRAVVSELRVSKFAQPRNLQMFSKRRHRHRTPIELRKLRYESF